MRIASLDRLVHRLSSPDESERCDALWLLIYGYPWRTARPQGRQRRYAFERVAAVLRDDPHEPARMAAAHVLRSATRERTFDPTPHLLRALREDPAPAVRGEAAESLAWRPRSAPRVDAALAAGLADPAPSPRFWCLYAVGALGLRALRPAVEALVGDPAYAEPWWTVGQEAQDVLTYWDTGSWPEHPPPSEAEDSPEP